MISYCSVTTDFSELWKNDGTMEMHVSYLHSTADNFIISCRDCARSHSFTDYRDIYIFCRATLQLYEYIQTRTYIQLKG